MLNSKKINRGKKGNREQMQRKYEAEIPTLKKK